MITQLGKTLKDTTELPPDIVDPIQQKIVNDPAPIQNTDQLHYLMYSMVSNIVSEVPIYGISQLDVRIGSQLFNGVIQVIMETEDFTRFIIHNGTLEKIVVQSAVPEGSFEQRFTQEQKSAAISTMYYVPNRLWSDSEIAAQFIKVVRTFGVADNQLLDGFDINRTKINIAKPIQPINMPSIPAGQVSGPDAFITVTSGDVEVVFRTEKVGQDYQLALVKLLNIL